MPIRFVCPFGHPLVVPDERAGKRGRCPVCRQRLIIPTPDDNSPGLQRLPWKRGWHEERISVDESGAVGQVAAAGEAVSPVAGVSAAPSWTEALATLAVSEFSYPLDGRRAWRTRILGALLGALAILSAAPAMTFLSGAQTPAWCWFVLVASALLAGGALGSLWLPDWSTLWCAAWVAGVVTSGYFVALCTAIVAPPDRPLPLGMEHVRSSAAGWSGLMVLVCGALCYASARMSSSWRFDYEAARLDWHRRREGQAAQTDRRGAPGVAAMPSQAHAQGETAMAHPVEPAP